MCYSAETWNDYRQFEKDFQVSITIKQFVDMMRRRKQGIKTPIPKALLAAFRHPRTDDEALIKSLADEFDAAETSRLEEDLFRQRKRLADAERSLQTKPTKAATEHQRIAANKIAWLRGKLADLRRTELTPQDSRIYPGHYCPVMISENGQRTLVPMRYQCRPAGKPALYDTKYPGTYNARRDNLEGFWKGQFGVSHGLIVARAFYENVDRHRLEGRELAEGEKPENVILKFEPKDGRDMLVACLWSRWTAPGEPELLSFAAITDEPPPEVAAAGHDRCIIPIRRQNIDAWLNPKPNDLAALYAILDDRERPYYEHRLAA